MTENMAGRGEGLAGLVAKWQLERRKPRSPAVARDFHEGYSMGLRSCAKELETALEAAAPAGTAPRPYRAENEGGGCKECHHGDDWTVVYAPPDGSEEIGEGETWDNQSPAEEMADSLNDAFGRGWRAALATPSPQALPTSLELAVRKLEEASMTIHDLPHESRGGFQWVKLYDALKIIADSQRELLATQPLKEGISERAEDGATVGDEVTWIGQEGKRCRERIRRITEPQPGNYVFWVGKDEFPVNHQEVELVLRPSSVPVGEQKQEDGAEGYTLFGWGL